MAWRVIGLVDTHSVSVFNCKNFQIGKLGKVGPIIASYSIEHPDMDLLHFLRVFNITKNFSTGIGNLDNFQIFHVVDHIQNVIIFHQSIVHIHPFPFQSQLN